MKDFSFMIPQNIEFGVGALKKLPDIMKENHLDHVFLISDHGLEAIGVVKRIQDIIEESGLKCTTYLEVKANPTAAIVAEATDLYTTRRYEHYRSGRRWSYGRCKGGRCCSYLRRQNF